MNLRFRTLLLASLAFIVIFGLGFALNKVLETAFLNGNRPLEETRLSPFQLEGWFIWAICGVGWLLIFLLITYPEKLNHLVEQNTKALAKANQCLIAEIMERGKIEQTLEEIITTNNALLQALPDMLFRVRADGIFLDYRSTQSPALLLPPSAFLGKSLTEVLPPELAAQTKHHLEKALQGKGVELFEYSLNLNETLSYYEARITVSGENEVLIIVRDISERKRTEQALLEHEQLLRIVVSNSPIILSAFDSNGIFTLSEGKGLESLGLQAGQVVGSSVFAYSQNDLEGLAALNRVLEGKALKMEGDYGGKVFDTWYEPIFDKNNKVTGAIGIATDVTNHKLVERALHQKEIALQEERDFALQVMNTMGQGLAVIDADFNFKFVNPALTNLLGYSEAELMNKKSSETVFPPDLEVVKQKRVERLAGKNDSYQSRFVRKDGSLVFAEVTGTPILRDGKVTGLITVISDLTERRRAEEEIRMALQKEKELSDLRSRFVMMTSHEFRTPLSTILSSTELLERYSANWSEENKHKHLQRIQITVKNMVQLLNDILLIGTAEAGKLEFNPVLVDLSQFCSEVLEEIEAGIGAKHNFEIDMQSDCRAAYIDEKLLRQILTNLLTNAVKYSPVGSTIQFHFARQPEKFIFRISDQGIGIPLEDQTHLFNPFHRADNVGEIVGTGLGLTIVKKCLDLHGGSICLSSAEGFGTTFQFSLPLTIQSYTI